MEILKRFGCRVLAPLFLTAVGFLMIVVVPMNANQFLAEEGKEVDESGNKESELHQPQGLIYMDLNQDVDFRKPDPTYNFTETSLSK